MPKLSKFFWHLNGSKGKESELFRSKRQGLKGEKVPRVNCQANDVIVALINDYVINELSKHNYALERLRAQGHSYWHVQREKKRTHARTNAEEQKRKDVFNPYPCT